MKTSERGMKLIREFEGVKLFSYLCPAGVWTIGYGHTKGVKEGDTCSEEQARAWLRDDLRDAEAAVNQLVQVPLTQSQFDALASFTFNLGVGNLANSTLLRLLNASDYAKAAGQFPRWTKVRGKELPVPGLVRRRAAEQALFLGSADS